MANADMLHASHDTAEVRRRLLDAAEELFAERGYEAASVRDITRNAGCNIAAVNYHFGGKEALYREACARRMDEVLGYRVRVIREALAAPDADLAKLLRAFAEGFAQPIRGTIGGKRILLLIGREMVDPRLPAGMLFERMIGPVAALSVEGLRRFCPDLSPTQMRLSLMSLASQLIQAIHISEMCNRPGALPEEFVQDFEFTRLLDHIVAFSLSAIERMQEQARAEREGAAR